MYAPRYKSEQNNRKVIETLVFISPKAFLMKNWESVLHNSDETLCVVGGGAN